MDYADQHEGPSARLTCPLTHRGEYNQEPVSYPRTDRSDGAAVHSHVHLIVELEPVLTLLRQASDHQTTLLMPSHPSPARVAALRSWLHSCVKSVAKVQKCQAQTMRSDEAAQMEEFATCLAAAVDAFQVYASTLETFRSAGPRLGLSHQQRSLAAVAEDEKLMVGCRATLRESMQQLVSVLQADI